MKKIFFLAAASAVFFASCAQESKVGVETTPEVKTISSFGLAISSPQPVTSRSNEEKTNATAVTFGSGLVMVIKASGEVAATQALDAAAAATASAVGGLVPITGSFTTDVRVLVFGNLPTAVDSKGKTAQDNLTACADLTAIGEVVSEISTQTAYGTAVLGNVDTNGNGTIDYDELAPLVENTAVAGGGSYKALATVDPMISRLEIADIAASNIADKDGNVMIDFNVTGVFLSNFYPSYNYFGEGEGTMFNQDENNTDFAALLAAYPNYTDYDTTGTVGGTGVIGGTTSGAGTNIGRTGTVTVGTPNYMKTAETAVAVPATNTTTKAYNWAYNVAPKGMPNVIIRLQITNGGVKTLATNTNNTTYNGTRYLRIQGYLLDGELVGNFKRGTIYRLGGTNPIKFKPEDLKGSPVESPDKVLQVGVTVEPWDVEYPTVNV